MSNIDLALIHYDANQSEPYCDEVVQALREKRDREKGCDYCNNPDIVLDMAIGCKYCSECGRKLDSEVHK